MKKALRIFIMSTAVCFCLTFALIIINAVMGVFIGIGYYFMLFGVLSLGSTISLILIDAKRIFSKKKVRKVEITSNVTRKTQQRSRHIKRKIS
ncbi:hypothetical protein [Romboutsia sp.]|uniref:hypothetical protein n=1 Tax=Romboutsia sp. TaxID=1965302 RepID=UPI003F3C77C9